MNHIYRWTPKTIFLKYVNKAVTIAIEHRVREIASTMRADGFRNKDNYLHRNNHTSNSTYIEITIDGCNDCRPNYNLSRSPSFWFPLRLENGRLVSGVESFWLGAIICRLKRRIRILLSSNSIGTLRPIFTLGWNSGCNN